METTCLLLWIACCKPNFVAHLCVTLENQKQKKNLQKFNDIYLNVKLSILLYLTFNVRKKKVKRAINMLKIYFIIIREQQKKNMYVCEKRVKMIVLYLCCSIIKNFYMLIWLLYFINNNLTVRKKENDFWLFERNV